MLIRLFPLNQMKTATPNVSLQGRAAWRAFAASRGRAADTVSVEHDPAVDCLSLTGNRVRLAEQHNLAGDLVKVRVPF